MKAYFYPYYSNNHGYYCQYENCTKVLDIKNTKKFAIENCDLRHPVLTKSEYFDCIIHDIKGVKLNEYEILANKGLYVFKNN